MPRAPQPDRPDHLDEPSLAGYAHGRLADAEMARVEQHLRECAACCEVVEATPADALLALLRARGAEVAAALAGSDDSAGPPGFQVPSSFEVAPTTGGSLTTQADPGRAADGAGPLAGRAIPAGLVDHPRYRVEAVLGAGGMGTVYLAEHRLMERPVALKVVRPDLVGRAALVDRFRREARAAAKLAHPNIVTAYDAEQAGETQMLVMEYVRGTDLARLVRDRGPLPAAEACDLARQAATGLQHAHEHGMVHRDIKPQNLMLTAGGQVKILDFGLARFASEFPAGGVTADGAILGSADYVAPEQVEDPRTADIRSDLYGLGCTLYFLLAGRPPFPGGTILQKLTAHAHREPAPLAGFRADLPPGLAAVVGRLMAKDPAARFPSPAEAAAALARFAESAPAEGRGGGRRWRPVAVAAAALLAVGLVAALTYRIRSAEGTLVVEVDDPAITVDVGVNGRDVLLRGGGIKELRLRPGPHRVRATRDGKPILDELVTIERDGKRLLHVRFQPDAGPPVAPPGPVARRAPAGGPPPPGEAGAPSPLDRLDPAAIPAGERLPWQPEELVAVYGSNRQRHWYNVIGVAASQDGRRFASSGGDRAIRVWDAQTMRERAVVAGHADTILAFAFSPDGRRILSGATHGDPTLRLWDAETGAELRRFAGHGLSVESVAFSPDGRRALSGSQDGSVRLWDAGTGKELRQFGHGTWVWAAIFAPDGRRAFSGSSQGIIRQWDLEGGRELRAFAGHKEGIGIRSLAITPDGRRLLSGSDDRTLRLWDAEAGKELRHHDLPGDVHDVAFAADGRRAIGRGGRTVLVIDGEAGGEVARLDHPGGVRSAALSADGRRVVTGGDDGVVRLWDAETAAELHRSAGHEGGVLCVAFAADGRHYVSGSWDNTIRLWDAGTGREVRPIDGPTDEMLAAAISPDGRRLLSAGFGRLVPPPEAGERPADYPIWVWDATSGREVGRLTGHAGAVRGLVISADGRRALSCSDDRTARLWDVEGRREVRRFEGHDGIARTCDLSADGRWALTGDDRSARLWDVESGRELRRLEPGDWVGGVAFAPDGRRALVGGGDKLLRLWDLGTGEVLHKLDGHAAGITCVAFSPDGRDAYSGSEDKSVRFWRDINGPTPGHAAFPTWHTERVTALAVAPDGKLLASADAAGRIVLWDAPAGTKLREVMLPGQVGGLAISADGRHLATANGNGTAYLLRLAPAPAAGEGR